jgi:hypothetical protein
MVANPSILITTIMVLPIINTILTLVVLYLAFAAGNLPTGL